MQPLPSSPNSPDSVARTLRFGAPAWRGRVARVCATVAAVAVAALALAPLPVARPVQLAALALCALIAGVCAAAALWTETLELDLRAWQYRYRRGFGRRAHIQAGSLDSVRRLELSVRPHLDVDGQPDPRCALSLRIEAGVVPALRGQPEERALAVAAHLSDELGRPLHRVPALERGRRRALGRTLLVGAVWACLMAVVAVMLWPTLRNPHAVVATWSRPAPVPSPSGSRFTIMGDRLYAEGQLHEAERMLRHAVEAYPRDPDAWNSLAYALADQNKLDEALGAAERAHNLDPLNGGILDTVGEMHERRGELREAVTWYEAALPRFVPFDAVETHAKLGRTLLALGRRDEAFLHLQQAMSFHNNRWAVTAFRLMQEARHGARKDLKRSSAPSTRTNAP